MECLLEWQEYVCEPSGRNDNYCQHAADLHHSEIKYPEKTGQIYTTVSISIEFQILEIQLDHGVASCH